MKELADLYAEPLSEFVSARDRLAAAVKEGGDGDRAARIKKLRKPSVPVWLANAVGREHPEALDELFAAGDALRGALESGDPADARRATEVRRRAVVRAVTAATERGDRVGASITKAVHNRLARLFYLAATDDGLRTMLRDGVLQQEPSGEAEELAFPAPGSLPDEPDEREGDREHAVALAAEADALERHADELEARADRLEADGRAARTAARRARDEATKARKLADRA